jgi:glycosyltransferase involved in cell wall biosynthesis
LRIVLFAADIGQPTSGQSRFLLNLARGLRLRKVDLAVAALGIAGGAQSILESIGVEVLSGDLRSASPRVRISKMMNARWMGRRAAELVRKTSPPDWYVNLSDHTVAAIEYLPVKARSCLICNGDMALLFLSPSFYDTQGFSKQALSLGMTRFIRKNAQLAARYSVRFANSRFTQNLMSYVYSIPFEGIVPPPVDRGQFRPRSDFSEDGFVLVLGRSQHEQNIELIRPVAAEVPVRCVGGLNIPRAENLGVVPDERLVELYAGARILAFPMISEPFGYSVAEAMCCGTPPVVFDAGGPAEQVVNGETGWSVASHRSFIKTVVERARQGYPREFRRKAWAASERYGIEQVTDRFLYQLAAVEIESTERSPSAGD